VPTPCACRTRSRNARCRSPGLPVRPARRRSRNRIGTICEPSASSRPENEKAFRARNPEGLSTHPVLERSRSRVSLPSSHAGSRVPSGRPGMHHGAPTAAKAGGRHGSDRLSVYASSWPFGSSFGTSREQYTRCRRLSSVVSPSSPSHAPSSRDRWRPRRRREVRRSNGRVRRSRAAARRGCRRRST